MTRIILCLTPFLLLISCYSTESISNKYVMTKLADTKCDSSTPLSDKFFTYYSGETITFDYEPIALLTYANGNNNNRDLLYDLKTNARKICADGIINLTQDINEGKYSHTRYSYDNKRNDQTELLTYNIQKFTGMAVKLKNPNQLGLRVDSLFYQKIAAEKAMEAKKLAEEQQATTENNQTKNPLARNLLIFGGALALFIYIVLK